MRQAPIAETEGRNYLCILIIIRNNNSNFMQSDRRVAFILDGVNSRYQLYSFFHNTVCTKMETSVQKYCVNGAGRLNFRRCANSEKSSEWSVGLACVFRVNTFRVSSSENQK